MLVIFIDHFVSLFRDFSFYKRIAEIIVFVIAEKNYLKLRANENRRNL